MEDLNPNISIIILNATETQQYIKTEYILMNKYDFFQECKDTRLFNSFKLNQSFSPY